MDGKSNPDSVISKGVLATIGISALFVAAAMSAVGKDKLGLEEGKKNENQVLVQPVQSDGQNNKNDSFLSPSGG